MPTTETTNDATPLPLYSQAPLPFRGQKRRFFSEWKQTLQRHITGDGEGWTIVDVFGGSGILSHVAARLKPKARVIYNDYDDYHLRVDNIKDTIRLHRHLRTHLQFTPHGHKMNAEEKQTIAAHLQAFDGFLDCPTLCCWLLFSGGSVARNMEELMKKTWYNNMPKSHPPLVTDYLHGVERVKEDFESLMKRFYDHERCVFVLDPPYVNSDQQYYRNEDYFTMVSFLKVAYLTRPPFVMFGSDRSEVKSYFDFTQQYDKERWKQFAGYECINKVGTTNYANRYTDVMMVKF